MDAAARILALSGIVLPLCAASFIVGDRSFKLAASIIAACWTAVVLTELVVGSRFAIVFAGDIVCGAGLVWIAWRSRAGWPIFLVATEALLILINALAFGGTSRPSDLEILGYNALIVCGPIYMTGMAFWQRFKARGR